MRPLKRVAAPAVTGAAGAAAGVGGRGAAGAGGAARAAAAPPLLARLPLLLLPPLLLALLLAPTLPPLLPPAVGVETLALALLSGVPGHCSGSSAAPAPPAAGAPRASATSVAAPGARPSSGCAMPVSSCGGAACGTPRPDSRRAPLPLLLRLLRHGTIRGVRPRPLRGEGQDAAARARGDVNRPSNVLDGARRPCGAAGRAGRGAVGGPAAHPHPARVRAAALRGCVTEV
jgi:hypothetical protein